jgi:biopolymer transport protein ExbB
MDMMETLLEKFVINGGPMMFLLVPCSFLMVGGILQALIRLRRFRVISPEIQQSASAIQGPADRLRFLDGMRIHAAPLAHAVWFTLKHFDESADRPRRNELQESLDNSMDEVEEELYSGMNLLATLYTIAPLLGLMGTILGMIEAFSEFQVSEQRSIRLLSIGIQEALITTLWGLGIAIPAFVAVQWFQSRIRRYTRIEMRTLVMNIVDHYYGTSTEDSSGGPENQEDPARNRPVS